MFYFIFFIIIPQMLVCFIIKGKKDMDPDRREGREELGGVRGRKTVIRVY